MVAHTKPLKSEFSKIGFIGTYPGKLNSGYRLIVPAEFRQLIGSEFILSKGFEKALLIIPIYKWSDIVSPLNSSNIFSKNTREVLRYLVANSYHIRIDNQGRFVIPNSLRNYFGVRQTTENIIFAGMLNYVEIWTEQNWQMHQNNIAKKADKLASLLNASEI